MFIYLRFCLEGVFIIFLLLSEMDCQPDVVSGEGLNEALPHTDDKITDPNSCFHGAVSQKNTFLLTGQGIKCWSLRTPAFSSEDHSVKIVYVSSTHPGRLIVLVS